MANPFTIGTVTLLPNGPGAGTDNITSLASATARGLGVLDCHTALNYDWLIPPIKIKSAAASVSATGYARLLIITSEDNTVWTDGISPTAASDQSAKIVTATVAGAIVVAVNATTYYFPEVSVASLLGYIPLYCAVVVHNVSGAAFDATATNFSANSLALTYT